jgi:hypothetical protein
MSPKLIQRAIAKSITDIGQLSKEEKRLLNKYVRNGTLVKGKGGPFPIPKMVYAAPGYNFQEERNRLVREVLAPFAVMETKENLWKGSIEKTSLESGVYYIEISWYDIEENSGYVRYLHGEQWLVEFFQAGADDVVYLYKYPLDKCHTCLCWNEDLKECGDPEYFTEYPDPCPKYRETVLCPGGEQVEKTAWEDKDRQWRLCAECESKIGNIDCPHYQKPREPVTQERPVQLGLWQAKEGYVPVIQYNS